MKRRMILVSGFGLILSGCVGNPGNNSTETQTKRSPTNTDSPRTRQQKISTSYLIAAGWFTEVPEGVDLYSSDAEPVNENELLSKILDATIRQDLRENSSSESTDDSDLRVSKIYTREVEEDAWKSLKTTISEADVEYNTSNGLHPGYFFSHKDKPVAVDFVKQQQ